MRIGDTIQSKYLKVTDLPGREQGHADLTIKDLTVGKFNDGRESLDCHFHETEKILGLNVTNKRRIMEMFGEDVEVEDLQGKRIRVYAERTQDSGGRECWGVRICAPPDTIQSTSAAARNQISAAMQAQGVQPKRVPNNSPETTLRPEALNGAPPEVGANYGDPVRDAAPAEQFPNDVPSEPGYLDDEGRI